MARKYDGTAVKLGVSLKATSAVALDLREYVDTVSDLYNPASWVNGTFDAEDDTNNVYVLIPSQRVSVHNEKTIYQFTANTVSSETINKVANWSRLATYEDVINNVVGAQLYKGSKSSLSVIESIQDPHIGDLWNLNQAVSTSIPNSAGTQVQVTEGTSVTLKTSTANFTATIKTIVLGKKMYFYPVDTSTNKIMTAVYGTSFATWSASNTTDIYTLVDEADNIFPSIAYDPFIQGMNYCCARRIARLVDYQSTQTNSVYSTKAYEDGETIKFFNESATLLTGVVKFESGKAVIIVDSGTTKTTYEYKEGNLYRAVTTIEGKTPVFGEWDAQGSTLQDVASKTDLVGGIVKVGVSAKADKLSTARKIDGLEFDGSSAISRYVSCSTTADTKVKAVTITGFTGNVSGACVRIKFDNANTATEPQLNVSGKGAKDIKVGDNFFKDLKAGIVYQFVYNGTNWQVSGGAGSGLEDGDSDKLDLFADINKSSTIVSGYSTPYDIDVNNLSTSDPRTIAIFEQMYADYTSTDNSKTLKFIICNGVRCKFDIVSCNSNEIRFNLISMGKFYDCTMTRTSTTMATIAWNNRGDSLSDVFNQVVSLGNVANLHEKRIVTLEANVATALNRTTWVDLDA